MDTVTCVTAYERVVSGPEASKFSALKLALASPAKNPEEKIDTEVTTAKLVSFRQACTSAVHICSKKGHKPE